MAISQTTPATTPTKVPQDQHPNQNCIQKITTIIQQWLTTLVSMLMPTVSLSLFKGLLQKAPEFLVKNNAQSIEEFTTKYTFPQGFSGALRKRQQKYRDAWTQSMIATIMQSLDGDTTKFEQFLEQFPPCTAEEKINMLCQIRDSIRLLGNTTAYESLQKELVKPIFDDYWNERDDTILDHSTR